MNRSLSQNAKLHSILNDISEQVVWQGMKFSVTVWKRLCMASYLREKGKSPLLIPALDGEGIDIVYERSSRLSVETMSELIEWCYCFGAENGVMFRSNREEV